MRLKLLALLLIALLLTPTFAFAQNIQLEFTRWDAQINAQTNSDQMQIAEAEQIHVINGTLSRGSRFWTQPVQVQAVYIVGSNNTPVQLSQGNGQPGTYAVTQNGTQTTLQYTLPQQVSSGSTFTVQINYLATSPTSGMVDWTVIPGERDYPVRSSTIRVRFPNGQAPDSSLVRISRGNGTAQVNGNEVVIQSQGEVPARQPFSIQIPFGAGVGAASGNTGNQNPGVAPNPNNPGIANNPGTVPVNPSGDQGIQLPGGGTLLLILCVVGFLLLVGGGSLLRGLLGGLGGLGGLNRGGGLGGPFGGGQFPGGTGGLGGPFNDPNNEPLPPSGGLNRGFRPSADQNRQIGNVGDDKDSGGGVGFS